ncbi:low molecular weight protein-tyrosine-phosphatase [Lipingzhangella sp. LS1_29]|uniref:protein-tyrosine-phosphatase n=1 Tax=Lipingzhangella rawalii TaxID=2055835 RepID=A0ABU2H9F3_9ACTN|nr:low molecular weight protein-tyrosine-phosphatase [Lipingzhangella rawalii]MDS1271943.1 low molecular weight protein-tyrosine-phosphatase [Lipingzhangella rawalii]
MSLPPPRDSSGPYRVCLVCLGNICRSPTAEQVLRADVDRAGLTDAVVVDSAGTGSWHIGSGMDPRAAATLRVYGYPTEHVARRFETEWFAHRDLVLAMDGDNHAELRRRAPTAEDAQRLAMFRSFAPDAGPYAEVPDPYYGGDDGFATVLGMVEAASKGLTEQLVALLRP